ncbi:MAG: ribosome biogenesis GTPase YlqF [Clostridia bacterium]|nr:ribosome biogenesis GTPase YlqF [Clostridia bacterium]
MIENINWYPGHMKKTREMIAANLKLVDVVVEVVDARIPVSSRNPIIDEIVKNKRRIIVLNKSDLSDPDENRKWSEHFTKAGSKCLIMNCNSGEGVKKLLSLLEREQEDINSHRNVPKPLRMMIVGVPNVGKSSLINRLTGRKATQTGDKPGVTKGKQWLTLSNNMQLMDTPGVLWPKFEDPEVGLDLAFCGSIKDEILDIADLALELIKFLYDNYPDMLMARYKLEELPEDTMEAPYALGTMEAIALKRGFIMPGKRIDYERCGKTVLDEFRSGTIGKITLERLND